MNEKENGSSMKYTMKATVMRDKAECKKRLKKTLQAMSSKTESQNFKRKYIVMLKTRIYKMGCTVAVWRQRG